MRRLGLIIAGIGIAVFAFIIGRWCGSTAVEAKAISEEIKRVDRFAELDRNVLQSFPVRSNVMTSGTFVMQVWFSHSQLATKEVVLNCKDGHITVPAPNSFTRTAETQMLSVTGHVVSWTQEGAGYEANPKYVGLIDGDGMWGRIYGWGLGDQSVGFWRMYPKRTK